MIDATKKNEIREAIAANPDVSAYRLAVAFKCHSKTTAKLLIKYWRDRALATERLASSMAQVIN
jgi:hypothetical protein